jgi:hypothetical protein
MNLQRTISKALKTVGNVVGNAEKDIVVKKLRENPEYNATTGDFVYVNPKSYSCTGIVIRRAESENDIQRKQTDTFTVLIAWKSLPVEINTADKLVIDGIDLPITAASVDASLSLHRISVRAA